MKNALRTFALTILAMIAAPLSAQYTPDVLELDGTETLQFPADDRMVLTGGSTIEFWVQPDWTSDPGYDPVILANSGPEGPLYLVAMLRDRDGLGIMIGGQSAIAAFDFTDGKMHHIAIIDDGTSVAMLVDGTPVGIAELTSKALPSNGFWIGSADGENGAFPGAIASLRIWDVAVSQANLRAFAGADIGDDVRVHPDLEYLVGVSDFTNQDFLLQDYGQ